MPCQRGGEEGAATRIVSTCRDVTDRIKVHRELRIRASQQEAVARLGERALTDADLQKLFDEAVETSPRSSTSEFVKILELVPGDAELLLRAGVGWKPGLIGIAHVTTMAAIRRPASRSPRADRCIGKSHIRDAIQWRRHAARARRRQQRLLQPIAGRDGRAYGVVSAHSARAKLQRL